MACELGSEDFPSYLSLLIKKPPVRIFHYSVEEDIYVSASVARAKGNGGYFEYATSVAFLNYMRQALNKEKQEKPLMVDVGANIGIHALYVAGNGFEVHAFEPHPNNARLLVCSHAANGKELRSRLFVNTVALADKPGELCMEYSPTNRGNSYMVACNASAKEQMRVPVQTLDSYWNSTRLARRRITLLKIDVEGYESLVLSGATQMLKEQPPYMIQAEFHAPHLLRSGVRPQALFNILMPLGYKVKVDGQDITGFWLTWANTMANNTKAIHDLVFTL